MREKIFTEAQTLSLCSSVADITHNLDKMLVVVIEGPDGIGKSTIVKELHELLNMVLPRHVYVRRSGLPAIFRDETIENTIHTDMFGRTMLLYHDAIIESNEQRQWGLDSPGILIYDRSVFFSSVVYNLPHLTNEQVNVATRVLFNNQNLIVPDTTIILTGNPFVDDDTDIAKLNKNHVNELYNTLIYDNEKHGTATTVNYVVSEAYEIANIRYSKNEVTRGHAVENKDIEQTLVDIMYRIAAETI